MLACILTIVIFLPQIFIKGSLKTLFLEISHYVEGTEKTETSF